jgi:shikimate dehydrogenase
MVVSTLPGTAGAALVDAGFTVDGPLLDVVYEPWPTALASSAMRARRPLVGGLDVLVGQAARQVELMTGQPAPLVAMQRAGEAALAARA